nr:MAG TPA: hypothetical protein [Caudoviricetes sp.]
MKEHDEYHVIIRGLKPPYYHTSWNIILTMVSLIT